MDVQAGNGRLDLALKERPKAEVVAFGKLMAALAMMKSRDDMAPFQIEVYEDRTVHVPIDLLALAVQRLLDAGGWRPGPGELLQACEQVRQEIRKALAYDPSECAQCDGSGWEPFTDSRGDKRLQRCGCWQRHQATVQQLSDGSAPLALPSAPEREEA